LRSLLNLRGITEHQLTSIKRTLQQAGIAAQELRRGVLPSLLCVSEQDYSTARALVRKSFAEYAAAERAKWEHEWRTVHHGSYWRSLGHQLSHKPRQIALAVLRLL
jgi:hypothetical protein